MKREPVDSTVVASIGYDFKLEILEIEFHFQHAVYQYEDVPSDIWEEFKAAESKGKYFNQQIRHTYFESKIK